MKAIFLLTHVVMIICIGLLVTVHFDRERFFRKIKIINTHAFNRPKAFRNIAFAMVISLVYLSAKHYQLMQQSLKITSAINRMKKQDRQTPLSRINDSKLAASKNYTQKGADD